MVPLIKGLVFGLIGAVVFVPMVLLLGVLGVPLLFGTIAIAAVFAIPVILLAVLALPFVLVLGLVIAAVVVTAIAALKVALFVVLPIALVALAFGWLIRAAQARHREPI